MCMLPAEARCHTLWAYMVPRLPRSCALHNLCAQAPIADGSNMWPVIREERMARVFPLNSMRKTLPEAIQEGDAQGAIALLERAGRGEVLQVVTCPWGEPLRQCPQGHTLAEAQLVGAFCSRMRSP